MGGVVAAVDRLVGRAGLAADPQARCLSPAARAAHDIAAHQVQHGQGGLGRNDLAAPHVRPAALAKRQGNEPTTVGQGSHGRCHLHRCDRDAVAERQRGQGRVRPFARQDGRFRRNFERGPRHQAETFEIVAHHPRPHLGRQARGADVGRVEIHLLQRHHLVLGMEVRDAAAADLKRLGRIQQGGHVGPAGVDGSGDREGLEHRSHFIGGGGGQVARVGRRPTGHAEHFARLDIGDDTDGTERLGRLGGRGQFVFQNTLDPQIDGNLETLATGTGGPDLVVEGALGRGQAHPAGIDIADHMAGRLTERMDTDVLGLEADAAEGQVVDRHLFPRGQAVDDQQTAIAVQGCLEPVPRHTRQGTPDLRRRRPPVPDLGRVDIEAVVDDVGGQQGPVAVNQVGANHRIGVGVRAGTGSGRQQGRVRGPEGQADKDRREGRQDDEDPDPCVLFGPGVGTGPTEGVLDPPHGFRQPAPGGREATHIPGRCRAGTQMRILNAHRSTSGADAAGTGAGGAMTAGPGSGIGARVGRFSTRA